MPARLIINADDFGLTPGINRAVCELHHAGAITSTTLMATGPAFEEAVQIALANPTLGVGCHIVLTDGVPVSHPYDIPTLLGADGKTFRPSLMDFAQAVLRGTVRENDILREASAQIQKLQRAGIDITHLDTHKHAHIFPAVSRPLLHIAERCGIGAIRNPFEPGWSLALNQGTRARRLVLKALCHYFGPRFLDEMRRTQQEVGTTDGTISISATGDLTIHTLAQTLTSIPDHGTWELVVHPGYNDAALDAVTTRLRHHRDVEREALMHQVPALRMHPHSPEFIHYGSVGPFNVLREIGQFFPQTGYEKVL
ncbi:YdjC-like protein [Granulicella pectinivorans]|uniref:YdjC-like protein n=1 Tax=Granulicella pectinivorans TaxID=474950 RepID=A0A1I6MPS8_9BACT|nr:ChbG/HpnK family deacetylase [Granulicella pectinivorans]SFS17617.1 YdjC-like protein [Granulicella pectinivorans]